MAFASGWLAGEHLGRAVRRLGRAREGQPGPVAGRGKLPIVRLWGPRSLRPGVPTVAFVQAVEDTEATVIAELPEPLDLVLFKTTENTRGAHLGVWMAPDEVFHLCKEIGAPDCLADG